ncbi:hypothetical protein FRC09_000096 [Ceratobasidium sp. 395]|nr:hypothetical protein FRC09_000096 [Ceratobasidium sp. 395]
MHSKLSKRNRPENFLDRPTNEVVRSRSTTPEPADAGPSNVRLGPTLQIPAAELRSRGWPQPSHTEINTSVPIVPVTSTVEPTGYLLASSRTGGSTVPALIQQPAISSGSTHAHSRAAATLKDGLRRLGRATSVIPPLSSAVGILTDCVDAMSIGGKGRRDFEVLAGDLAASVKMLERHLDQSNAVEITQPISDALSKLREEVGDIRAKQVLVKKWKHASAEQDIEEVLACYRRVDSLFQRLASDLALSGAQTASRNLNMTSQVLEVASNALNQTKENALNTGLDRMQPVREARYDADAADVRRNGCTADTRTSVLKNLVDWSNDEDGAKVYWMNGMAGTGKTTIAYSFCETLKSTNQLGASFFCSRLLPECRDTARIIPTLAYQLARTSLRFQEEIIKVINDDPDICATRVNNQFSALIATPLQKFGYLLRTARLVLVIDALDECSNRTATQQVLDALFHHASDLPVKFFVTCRPEPGLFDKVMAETLQTRSIFHLHDIERSLVQADIQIYLQSQLGAVQFADYQIGQLAERAGKLFIYAATVVRYLRPTGARVDTKKRLEVILKSGQSSINKAYGSLDALYRTIVAEALENSELEPWDVDNIKSLLYTVLCARVPLSIESLASLLGLESADKAEAGIECLRSVLHVSEGQKLVSTLHASFPDFMLDAGRSRELWCNERLHHQTLARRCFVTMNNKLAFNICGLESSFVLDKDMPDLAGRVDMIPSHLLYACTYWSEHMISASNELALRLLLTRFLNQHVLFWMEVMNLKKLISWSIIMLSGAIRWMKSVKMPHDQCALCLDALKFATVVAGNPVCNSTAHIYVSVLALWNRDSSMWMCYGAHLSKTLKIEGPAVRHRQSASLGQWNIGHRITSAVASPDGRFVASLAKDCTMHVWDAHTGALFAGPFVGPTARINLVTVSRDGSRIASSLNDNTIHVWDIQTGQALHAPLEGYDGRVVSLAFSPDGKQIASGHSTGTIYFRDIETNQTVASLSGEHLRKVRSLCYSPDGNRLVSSSNDCPICVWDVQANQLINRSLTEDTRKLWVVAFSGDGGRIISISDESAVHVWDARTAHVVNSIKGRIEHITSLACSPDGHRIALGTDYNTISIWDVETGQFVGSPYVGHPLGITFVTYSPDGHRIISGSKDGTVHIWDAQIEHAHSDAPARQDVSPVHSVCFSPDGKCIAAGYQDGTIRVWDAYTGAIFIDPFKVHSCAVLSVAFAPNGSKIVFCSYGYPFSVWDLNTGGIVVGRIEGDDRSDHSAIFSPDGRYVASASSDCTIRIWDAETGYPVGFPFERPTWFNSVAYSSDGHRLVFASYDKSIRVWDMQTSRTMAGPFQGHTACVNSAAFSPDGRRILSGSSDGTIRVWDAYTGHPIGEPFRGHNDSVNSIAYSPDGTAIASGSDDHTVRVWNAETGCTIAGPFQGHNQRVESVSYSPDGSCLASGSADGSIRIWRSPIHDLDQNQPLSNWTMNEDGWIVTSDSALLFWVPRDLRPYLNGSRGTPILQSGVWLSLDFKDAAIGRKWAGCFQQ